MNNLCTGSDALRCSARAAVALLVCVGLGACAVVQLKEESEAFFASTVMVGRVDCPTGTRGPIIVAAVQAQGAAPVAHQTTLHECGGYELIVPAGEFDLVAVADPNPNGRVDAGDPAGRYATRVSAPGTGVLSSLDFALVAGSSPGDTRLAGLKLAAPGTHSTQVGALADLDAPQFSAIGGEGGYWAPMTFFRRTGGNIYFLEPYDPTRIPVLFVHGAAGSPQDWRYFFDHLDRRRYQPWFFYYPSGSAVGSMSYLLYWKLLNLQLRYRFESLHIVAHSMGGLVVRSFLLDHGHLFPQVKLFISLSTPWGGESTATLGVRNSPAVVPSWIDMQPEGRFMQMLFARPLPTQVTYYLLFGYKGGYSMFRANNDGTVTLSSELRRPAQAAAAMIYGFDEDHASILRSPAVLAQFQSILDRTDLAGASRADVGRLRVRYDYPKVEEVTRPLPILLMTPLAQDGAPTGGRITLTLPDAGGGQPMGPIPAGVYEATLVAVAFRTEPRSIRVRIGADATPQLEFRLSAQGALSGYIGADLPASARPAGSYVPPHESVQIESITLTGAGIRRTLRPREDIDADILERYRDGKDVVVGAYFSFVALPAGDYQLSVSARGYAPYTARYQVVPGRPTMTWPVQLAPDSP
jgi:pimeloyl-ACP methyl ester carboxylesterase